MFRFETNYDLRSLTAMAKALRKTLRRKHSRRSHIMGWIVIVLAGLLSWPLEDGVLYIEFRDIFTWLAMAVMLFALIFEDRLNAFFARKRMLPGTENAFSSFSEESYISETEVGKTEFFYNSIQFLAETKEYFVFLFSNSHAQIYDKATLQGGTQAQFREFIEQKTGKQFLSI